MGRTICLVTYELAPVNRGGAGVLISALAETLARAGNHVVVLADMPEVELGEYRKLLRDRGVDGITVYGLAAVAHDAPQTSTVFQSKSAQFRAGLHKLAEKIRFDLVEFFEYAGSAFETLVLRAPGDVLASTAIAVRIHGSLGMIDHVEDVQRAGLDRHAMYAMEGWAMRLADLVIAPLDAIGEDYRQLYGVDPERLVVCPPPMELLLADLRPEQERAVPAHERILFYGKLQRVKGCDVFVDASVILAGFRPELRFLLVGADTDGGPAGTSMQQHLLRRIPEGVRDRFEFIPHVPRAQLPSLAATAFCAVVPSRSESFCLAAHELLRLGCPLILSDIAAFRDAFPNGERCLKFDGTAEGLAARVERLLLDPEVTHRLAVSGRSMRYADSAAIYAGMPLQVRIPRREIADFAGREVHSLGLWAARGPHLAETGQRSLGARLRALVKSPEAS